MVRRSAATPRSPGREAAAAGSHRQALAHFSAALRHGHRLADADLARLVDEHAWELYNAGRFTEALHGGERAVRLRRRSCPTATAPGGDGRDALAAALVRLSRHRFMAGDPDGADAAAAEAVALLDRPPEGSPSARAFAATYLGAIRALTGHPGPDLPDERRRTRSCAGRGSSPPPQAARTWWRSAATTRASPAPTSTTTPASRCSTTACAPGWRTASTRSQRAPTPTWPSSATASTGSTSWSVASPTASPSPGSVGSPPTPTTSPCTAPCWRCGAAGGRRRKRRCARAGRQPSPGCPTPLGRTAGCWPAGRRTPTPA